MDLIENIDVSIQRGLFNYWHFLCLKFMVFNINPIMEHIDFVFSQAFYIPTSELILSPNFGLFNRNATSLYFDQHLSENSAEIKVCLCKMKWALELLLCFSSFYPC